MGRSKLIRRLQRNAKPKEEASAPESIQEVIKIKEEASAPESIQEVIKVKEEALNTEKGYFLRDDYCICDVCAKGRHREFFEEGALAFRPIPTPTYLPKFKVRNYQHEGIKLAFDQEIYRRNSGLNVEWVEHRDAAGVKATLGVASSHTWPNIIAIFHHQSLTCNTYQEAQTQIMATYLKYQGICVHKYRTDAAAQTFDYEAAYSSTPKTEEDIVKGRALFQEIQKKFEVGHTQKPDKHRVFLHETPQPKEKTPKVKLTTTQKIRIAKGLAEATVIEEEDVPKIDVTVLQEMIDQAEAERKAEHIAESALTLHQRKFVDPKEDLYHFQTFETWVDTLPLAGETFYAYPEMGIQLNPEKKIKKIKEPNTVHWHFSRTLDHVRLEVRKFVAENPITITPFFTPNGLTTDGTMKKAHGFLRLCKNRKALYEFVHRHHPVDISGHFHTDNAKPIKSVLDERITGLVDLEQHLLFEEVTRICRTIWRQSEEAFGRSKEAPFPVPTAADLPPVVVEAF